MTYQDVEARHAQEDKLIEMARLMSEVCHDMEPGDYNINVTISKDGTVSVYTGDNLIDVTWFTDGQIYYTDDWNRMLGRIRKERDDDTLRADH